MRFITKRIEKITIIRGLKNPFTFVFEFQFILFFPQKKLSLRRFSEA
jgi:hypothetical protein